MKLSSLYLGTCLWVVLGCTGGQGRINIPEQERIALQNGPAIRAIHWYRTDGFWIFGEPYGMLSGQRITAEDPITTVKTQFLSSLTARLDSTNIQSIDSPSWWGQRYNMIRACCIEDGLKELRTKFSAGLIMDFASDIPTLEDSDPTDFFDGFHWDWSKFGQKPKFNLYYKARARLIRLDDHQILWQGRCVVGSQASKVEWLEFSEWTFPNKPFIRERLDVAANKCAEQLVGQWFEPTAMSDEKANWLVVSE